MATNTTQRTPRTLVRAEPVGSLMRDPAITALVDEMYADTTSAIREPVVRTHPEVVAELNRLADEQVRRVVQKQINAGLDVITDGEVRRATFLGTLYDSVEGFVPAAQRIPVPGSDEGVLNDPTVGSKLRKVLSPISEEATFMRGVTSYPFKVTLPAPSYCFIDWIPINDGAYEDRMALLNDVVAIEKLIAAEAVAAGAKYIQFDFPIYPAIVNEGGMFGEGGGIAGVGESREWVLERALEVDRAVTEDLPDDVTVALHLCRGSMEGGMWNGSLEPIAERIFNELPHDRFLFEWEDIQREGDYSAIKYLPKDRVMAMGLISTKTPHIEDEDEIVGKIEEAAQHLPIEQLALTTQCGFASVVGMSLVEAEDVQWRKLEMIGRIADRVWGQP